MKIALLTLGTRGDVQPYAVLGRALKARGHHVTLSTGRNFELLAKDYGLDYAPVEADFQALINSEEGKAMMKNPFMARKHFATVVEPMMIGALKDFYAVAGANDGVLYHVKALGDVFADQFPKRMIRANVIPAIEATSEFPHPVFSGLSLPGFLNRFTYKLADLGLAMMNKAVRQFRISSSLDPKFPKRLNLTSIYGVSPAFLPRPSDFPVNSFFTGFWHGESPGSLTTDLTDFVSSEKETVVVTFGSMPFEAKLDFKESLFKLAEHLDVRVLVIKGWGMEALPVGESDSVKVIDGAPFDKLFPKVHAVVHHGGIGTLAECLRAGVPSLSCPVIYPLGDQHFWGSQSYRAGCSPRPIPLRKLNYDALKMSVSQLLTSGSLRTSSRKMASQLASENGLENAVRIVEEQFSSVDNPSV